MCTREGTHTHPCTHTHTVCMSVAVCKAHMATGLDTHECIYIYICTCKDGRDQYLFSKVLHLSSAKILKKIFSIYIPGTDINNHQHDALDRQMDCHVVPCGAGWLRECQVWTSVYSLWLGFCFFQVTTHTHLVSTHQQQLLQKDFFKFLDTPVTLECKLWMYL